MIVEEMEGEGVPCAKATPSNSPIPSEGPAEKKGKFEVRGKGCFCFKLRIFPTLVFRGAVSWHYLMCSSVCGTNISVSLKHHQKKSIFVPFSHSFVHNCELC